MADAELAPRLARWGDARTRSEARRLAVRLDRPRQLREHVGPPERQVTIRPAADAMAYLTALLPAAAAVACFAALHHHAAAAAADAEDGRSRGQVMAE